MRFLSLFAITLLFIVVFSKKYEFEFDEEPVQEKRNPELHGATLMNRGFDFRQGGQVPPHPKSEIFEFTPSNKIYRVPGRPDLVFSVPKEVEVTNRAQHIERSSSEIFHSYQQTVTVDIGGFNFGIGLQYGNFGIGARYGREYGRIQDRLTQKFRATGRSLYFTSGYSCLALPYPFLKQSDIFKQVIELIPNRPTSAEDMEKVQLLLDYYGGYFVWSGIFGGQIRQFSFLTREIVERRDQRWVQEQFHLEFHYNLFNLTTGGFRNRSQIVVDNFFKLNSESELVFTGGFRNLQTNRTLVEWDRSIDDSPELLSGSFRPISDLITNNPEKKKNLDFMIKHYSNTGKLITPPASIKVNGVNKIPGYSTIGSGFDTMEMTSRRSVFLHDDEGFKRTTTWRNPFYPEHSFVVPSSINLRQRTESTEQNYTDVSMTKSEYEVKYANKWSSSGFLGMSRSSYEVFYYLNRFELFNEYSISTRRQISWYDLTLNPLIYFSQEMSNRYMDPDLKYMIDHLEEDYEKPGAKMYYRAIIDFWGTDFVTEAVMGGAATTDLYFKKDLIKTHEISRIVQQSSFSFFGLINSRNYNFKNDTRVAEWLRENAHLRSRFIGGRFIPGEVTTKTPWESFVESLRTDPVAIHYKFIPISFLVKDPVKQRNMVRAIEEYKREKMNIPIIKNN